ncbi:MAG: hypothetical protein ABSC08_20060, partial [Bryobacteraceae bacterium]
EVKALSRALEGDAVFAMLKGLHGEAHPAVWYLLLRGAHALIPRPEVLLLVSVVVAAAAILILMLRSPFSLPFLALLLMGRFTLYEYSVTARNYGISMLALFLFAVFYERHRERGCLLGVLLFLLANCNAHSVLLAGGLLLFWFVDILTGAAADRRRKISIFLYNAALAALGVVTCILTIFPTFNDAAVIDHPDGITFKLLCKGILLPSAQFVESWFPGRRTLVTAIPLLWKQPFLFILQLLWSLILFGSTLGLIRRTGAFLAALTTLVGLSLFFVVVYPGGYRHQALWLVFMICMYWMVAPKNAWKEPVSPDRLKPFIGPLSTLGAALFVLILLLQPLCNASWIRDMAHTHDHGVSSILARRPDLKQAVVIADPDYLVETLPYYVSNPTYLMREQRYGNICRFTRKARLELSLGDVLADARRLRQETGRPVVILLASKIDTSLPAQVYQEGFNINWKFTITPEQVRAFQSSTRLLGHFAPVQSDEYYDAYVMDN